jgi:hypothetical protein
MASRAEIRRSRSTRPRGPPQPSYSQPAAQETAVFSDQRCDAKVPSLDEMGPRRRVPRLRGSCQRPEFGSGRGRRAEGRRQGRSVAEAPAGQGKIAGDKITSGTTTGRRLRGCRRTCASRRGCCPGRHTRRVLHSPATGSTSRPSTSSYKRRDHQSSLHTS